MQTETSSRFTASARAVVFLFVFATYSIMIAAKQYPISESAVASPGQEEGR